MESMVYKDEEIKNDVVSEDDTSTDIFIAYCRPCGVMHPINSHQDYFNG